MSEVISPPVPITHKPAPRVGFVSLGCPKALTDSELILTQLSAEGYQTSKTFEGADLVIVNTCGFIDDAEAQRTEGVGIGHSHCPQDMAWLDAPTRARASCRGGDSFGIEQDEQ